MIPQLFLFNHLSEWIQSLIHIISSSLHLKISSHVEKREAKMVHFSSYLCVGDH